MDDCVAYYWPIVLPLVFILNIIPVYNHENGNLENKALFLFSDYGVRCVRSSR